MASVFVLIAVGIAVLVVARGNAAGIAGLLLLGMGKCMATLARATVIADRYGSAVYGALSGVAASVTTAARALGPVAAASLAAPGGLHDAAVDARGAELGRRGAGVALVTRARRQPARGP